MMQSSEVKDMKAKLKSLGLREEGLRIGALSTDMSMRIFYMDNAISATPIVWMRKESGIDDGAS
eukprot:scaffold1066_cov177-Skeletonema_marinoi.AAC.12